MLISALCLILFAKSMHEPVDHDENQFIASGVLLARHGLLPYRDYPYFHLPYMVYLYAAVFRVCPCLLLGARLVSTLCAVGVVSLLGAAAYRAAAVRNRHAGIIALGAGLLLISQPAFTQTTGFSWNHDLTELLIFASAFLVLRGIAGGYSTGGLLLAGASMGLAVGVRVTALPLLGATTVFVIQDVWKSMPRPGFKLVAFPIAAAGSLAPLALSFAASPRAFLFGNFNYTALATAWWLGNGSHGANATPRGKLLFPFRHVLLSPGAILLMLLAALAIGLWIRVRPRVERSYRREM
ncbi:MAG TPA: hypothetical protein VFC46_04790, partial [Humisphaera sp.]|nr:hypothetical protein [Humisphaera sp.]